MAKEFKHLDQMSDRPTSPVEGGDDHDIDAAGLHVAHEAVPPRPAFAGAPDASVAVLDHDDPPASLAVRPEIVSLLLDRLLGGRAAQVATAAPQRGPPSTPATA